MKKWVHKILKAIGEANKENFGTKRMDCCGLNNKSTKSQKNNNE